MMREYIFCSVMESPMMANRSFSRSRRPWGDGAFLALNLANTAESGLVSNS